MSMVPMMGNTPSLSPSIFERDENVGIAYGMGLTAEKVAQQWGVTRDAQDAFALASHQKAIQAQQAGEFTNEITPIEIVERFPNLATGDVSIKTRTLSLDEARGRIRRSKGSANCVRSSRTRGRSRPATVRRRRMVPARCSS